MEVVCLDLEGVLVPEIWINFAERTGIEELKATTRDIPDYDVLMKQRLSILDEHNLGMKDIQEVIDDMGPMEGARDFLGWLQANFQVVILSDTFYEFAEPLMRQLDWPTLFCHRLEVNEQGKVANYHLRMKNHKREAVVRFQELNFHTIAAGDSYNDTHMLNQANQGILFKAPDNVINEFPQFPVTNSYEELKAEICKSSPRF
ncbi:MAG: bifunctional phosphoserine phosphatase/homoserine phosphotransferase ThrH [Rhodospirillales bacterium]|nr:bifunctional phosphoserine phosphatase/homoserine phosphotransferase ThrH [Rhodospirillales bacterium]